MTNERSVMASSAVGPQAADGELSDQDLEVVVGGLVRPWTDVSFAVAAPAPPAVTGADLAVPFLEPAEA
jgi:hypothetical protein